VIGSGFGGLAVAVRLGARGYRVTVVEKLDAPGGRAYVRNLAGHVFDSGPTVITAPFLLEELWSLCGKNLADEIDMRPVDPFYRVRFHDGAVFDYNGDPEAMRREVAKFSPGDVQGYERFVQTSEAIFRVGFERLAHVPFHRWMDMARIVPDMMRLQSYRTVYGLVSRYVQDDRLRQVLSFHPLLVGGNPFSTTSIYSLIAFLERRWGVHFPIGGTGALVHGLVRLIEGLGGTMRYSSPVAQILVRDGRAHGVRLESGEELQSDLVVSNADAAWTYRYLLPEDARRKWTNPRIERAQYSMGLFVWYFGTNRTYPDVAHHTILLGPRYRELLQDIFQRKILADDFSLYLHRPTATDPGMAPKGMETFYVLSPVPNLLGDVDWSTQAEPYRRAVASLLSETVLPNLEASLTASEVMTPLDFQNNLYSFRGAGFSFQPLLRQSAYFRPHNQSEDVRGLYLVGAGTHPGAGLPGVLSSARVLDQIVPDPRDFPQGTRS
jgi:phytoene desaturase